MGAGGKDKTKEGVSLDTAIHRFAQDYSYWGRRPKGSLGRKRGEKERGSMIKKEFREVETPARIVPDRGGAGDQVRCSLDLTHQAV